MRNNARCTWANTPQNCATTNRGPHPLLGRGLLLRNTRPSKVCLFVVWRFIAYLRKSYHSWIVTFSPP